MKIGLDIDGVINNGFSDFSLESISVLKRIIDDNKAKIIIISSKQKNGTATIRNKLINLMKKYNIEVNDFIDLNYIGNICGIEIPSRVLGIVDYLKNNDEASYIVLDDEYQNDYKLLCLNHYKVNNGLKNKDYNKIKLKKVNLNNFKHINYKYRKLGAYEQATNNLIYVLKKIKDR